MNHVTTASHIWRWPARISSVIDSFVYLERLMYRRKGSGLKIRRLIGNARTSQTVFDKHIWRFLNRPDTNIRLHQVYILPVLLYGWETWTTTKELCQRLNSFDCWCLWKILCSAFPHKTCDERGGQTSDTHQPVSDILPVIFHERYQPKIITVPYVLHCRNHHHPGSARREGPAWPGSDSEWLLMTSDRTWWTSEFTLHGSR